MKGREYTVALAGNPNVGKSTVFNALTGMKQHTGNWPGKTVSRAEGIFDAGGCRVKLVDVPGTYSLEARSPEEVVAADYLSGKGCDAPDGVVVVLDGCCLERSLSFTLSVMSMSDRVVACVNLCDEAERRGIAIDFVKLESMLGVPVVKCAARNGEGLDVLKKRLESVLENGVSRSACSLTASEIYGECVRVTGDPTERDRRLDRIFTGRYTAMPIAALVLALVFFITLKGAAPLSDGLSGILGLGEGAVRGALLRLGVHSLAVSAICDGVLRVLFWVVSVMLPPMAIFFPLFTIIEDFGYLPRLAYNFDRCFYRCGACGKQALTMMMGLGCNAAGVTGCRIIDSPRERLIAILTNSLTPCNGRFPVIAVFISVIGEVTGIGDAPWLHTFLMCLAISLGIFATLGVSKLLSAFVLRGTPSAFTVELPPYRIPKARDVIVRSVFDRTLFVLGRAVVVAAPMGLVIWLLGNVTAGGESLMEHVMGWLEPIARLAGMDGVMLCAFVLALPAAEITVPLMLMGYGASGVLSEVSGSAEAVRILSEAGWSTLTAVCAIIFTLIHWPCSTTVITVYRETGSVRWTALSVLLPTVLGYLLCTAVALCCSP